jgi:hypothetical protein
VIKYSQTDSANKSTIKLTFKSLDQLLDAEDPSPYPHKEITGVAEDAIASHLADIPLKRDVELVIALPTPALNREIQGSLAETIREHFAFRASEIVLELKRKRSRLHQGLELIATTAAIAIIVAAVIKLIPESHKILTDVVQFFIAGVLTILNWVAIWDTYESYILEYRDLNRKMKVYEKIAEMSVRIEGA